MNIKKEPPRGRGQVGDRRRPENNTPKIDPFQGVVKPEVLREQIRACVQGDRNAGSYLRGALQWFGRRSPNPYIVPLLRRALQKAREGATLC